MFNPNDQMALPLLAIRTSFMPSKSSAPAHQRSARRTVRRPRPNIVRLIPGLTRLPIGYSPR
jgi:hypothetical protein